MNQTHIKVRSDQQQLLLPLNSNGNLQLSILKQYFPQATGLTYFNENQKRALLIESGSENLITSKKRKHVHETVEEIKGIQGLSSTRKTDMTKMKTKRADVHPAPAPQQRITKKIRLGWLRKTKNSYEQVIKSLGGIREIPLEVGKTYSVSDIKNLAVEEFSKDSEVTFANSEIQLGLFDHTILSSFKDSKGHECDLWTFLKERKSRNFTLYLITSLKGQVTPSGQNEKVLSRDWEENSSGSCYPNAQLSLKKVETKPKSSSQEFRKCIHLENNILIYYELIRKSEYTGSFCISYLLKDDLYENEFEEYGRIPVDTFDPMNAGHKVSGIEVDGKALLSIYTDNDSLTRVFDFPGVEMIEDGTHYILYDVNELNGKCDDKNGVGVITNCTDECKPVFTWYKDGTMISQGLFRYWINDIDKDASYKCIIHCKSQNLELTSSNFKWSEHIQCCDSTQLDKTIDLLKDPKSS
ncbi:hypothetical protein KQX54_013191 [Cotesia glomerata]|uniref:TAR DNA-binding protein 43 N-terminal domain-containing protein n=1 Tax=Cotesia glomerata TaxID=32391 RepID=A0AAV7HXK2_COTGL|nr:hypothetical protein KQX54_013191 [Cotesia glomerata]